MSTRFAPEAVADLEAAVEYLMECNPDAARSLVDRVFELTDRLEAGEFDGPEQRLSDGSVVRSWPLHPFRLYYQRDGEVLNVLRLYHLRRRPL